MLLIRLASRHRSSTSNCLPAGASVLAKSFSPSLPAPFFTAQGTSLAWKTQAWPEGAVSWAVSVFTPILTQVATRFALGYCGQFSDFSWVLVCLDIAMKCYWQVVGQEGGNFNRLLFNALCLEVSGGATRVDFQRSSKIDFLRKGFFLLHWILALRISSDLEPSALVQTQFASPSATSSHDLF